MVTVSIRIQEYLKLEIVAKEHGQNVSNLSDDQKEAFIKEGRERMLAMQMLIGVDQK